MNGITCRRPCHDVSRYDNVRHYGSFNHLVRAHQDRLRNLDAERLGSPEIDHHLKRGRQFHRKIGGIRPLKDFIHVDGRAPEVLLEGVEAGFPVFWAGTAGFKGSAFHGYRLLLKALIDRLPDEPPADPGPGERIVNLLGIVPGESPTWEGDFAEMGRVLGIVGLSANPVFGFEGGIDRVRDLARARRSIVFSEWGADAARQLESRFGIPWTDAAAVPVGAIETGALLESLRGPLALDPEAVRKVVEAEERRERHFLGRFAEATVSHDPQRKFAIAGPASTVMGISRFLTGTLGWLPSLLVITDDPSKARRVYIERIVEELLPGYGTELLFDEDAGEIGDAIVRREVGIVLGSELEREAADALGVPLIQVSSPSSGMLNLQSAYAGYRGGIRLAETVGAAIITRSW